VLWAGSTLIDSVWVALAGGFSLSATLTVKVAVPRLVAVPVSCPADERVIPAGGAPLVSVQV
jgi:hypothetical protein